MADIFVTFDHMHSMPGGRKPGWCHMGGRKFAARYNLDWNEIVKNGGIQASVLLATGDEMAKQLVEHAIAGIESA